MAAKQKGADTPKVEPALEMPRARPGGKGRKATSGTRKGNGAGWGGPAKGAATEHKDRVLPPAGPGRGHTSLAGEERRARAEERSTALLDNLYDLAFAAENEAVRVNASVHALNQMNGMPVQRVVSSLVDDLTDEERATQLAAFRRATLELTMPGRSDGVGNSGAGSRESDAGAPPSGADPAS